MNNKYLTKIAQTSPDLQKEASLTAAALAHLAQNLTTKAALQSRRAGRRVARAFQTGAEGGHDASLLRKATSAITSLASPEMEVMYREANKFGHKMAPYMPGMSPRAKVGFRQLTEGRLDDYSRLRHRMKLGPVEQAGLDTAMGAMEHTFKVPVKKLVGAGNEAHQEVRQAFKSNTQPILKNYLGQLTRPAGPVRKFKPGEMHEVTPLAHQAVSLAADPVAGALNVAKTAPLVQRIRSNKYLKKPIEKVENYFTTHQAELGAASPGIDKFKHGAKNVAYEYLVNPMSANIKNTAATMTDIYNRAKQKAGIS